jgi:hypothetical protein
MGGFGVEGAAGSSAEGPPIWFSGFLKTPQAHAHAGPGVWVFAAKTRGYVPWSFCGPSPVTLV